MQRAGERGKDNMSRGHGNHSARDEPAAAAGEVRAGVDLDGSGGRAGREGSLRALGEAAQERRGCRVPGADAALQGQQFQAHVAQGVARGAQKGRRDARAQKERAGFPLFLRAALYFTENLSLGAAQGEAALEGGDSRAEGELAAEAQFDGKFYRNAAQVKDQRGGCGNVHGQIYTFSIVMKTFFPN